MTRSRIALAAGLAAIVASSAALADDPMASTYGNTVVSSDSTGASASIFFNQDNSFTESVTGKDGKPVTLSGTWALKDDGKTICLTLNPMPGATGAPPAPSCTPLTAHAVGDTWSVTNDQKQTFSVTIKAGR